VQEKFREYYSSRYSSDQNLLSAKEREFGFAAFEGWMLRHKSFRDENELTSFLIDSVPRDAYVSCAYYEDPTAEMEKKGWKGADLVFDIDADHIPTSCEKVHDEWKCCMCGFAGKGTTPERCPVCSGEKFEGKTWPCEACLASAKAETARLADMLANDFGFSEKEIHVFFSGHRGYHIHVKSESVMTLDALARKEIVDYVLGLGLNLLFDEFEEKNPAHKIHQHQNPRQVGWRKRLASGISNIVLAADANALTNLGIGKKESKALLTSRDSLPRARLDSLVQRNVKGVGPETWRRIARRAIEEQSAKVDTVVTTDIHRLIRLPETLHGKTGFKKVGFRLSALDDFDPFCDAIAFKGGSITVLVSNAPGFRIGEEKFGPLRDQKVELPTAAALLLICRGRAKVVE
jgi:DNA primase small subunit